MPMKKPQPGTVVTPQQAARIVAQDTAHAITQMCYTASTLIFNTATHDAGFNKQEAHMRMLLNRIINAAQELARMDPDENIWADKPHDDERPLTSEPLPD